MDCVGVFKRPNVCLSLQAKGIFWMYLLLEISLPFSSDCIKKRNIEFSPLAPPPPGPFIIALYWLLILYLFSVVVKAKQELAKKI